MKSPALLKHTLSSSGFFNGCFLNLLWFSWLKKFIPIVTLCHNSLLFSSFLLCIKVSIYSLSYRFRMWSPLLSCSLLVPRTVQAVGEEAWHGFLGSVAGASEHNLCLFFPQEMHLLENYYHLS